MISEWVRSLSPKTPHLLPGPKNSFWYYSLRIIEAYLDVQAFLPIILSHSSINFKFQSFFEETHIPKITPLKKRENKTIKYLNYSNYRPYKILKEKNDGTCTEQTKQKNTKKMNYSNLIKHKFLKFSLLNGQEPIFNFQLNELLIF